MLYHASMPSPIGQLFVYMKGDFLYAISFEKNIFVEAFYNEKKVLPVIRQLDQYFIKKLRNFSVPMLLEGTTFQKKVWHTLQKIPYGTTVTYKHIAEQIQHPLAYRAVGLANHCNKIPIIIPCHRVIGSNNSLVGYAGGIMRKKQLLDIEGL